jgi:hypothetical protein
MENNQPDKMTMGVRVTTELREFTILAAYLYV